MSNSKKNEPLFYLYTNRGYVWGPGCGDPKKIGQVIIWGRVLPKVKP